MGPEDDPRRAPARKILEDAESSTAPLLSLRLRAISRVSADFPLVISCPQSTISLYIHFLTYAVLISYRIC